MWQLLILNIWSVSSPYSKGWLLIRNLSNLYNNPAHQWNSPFHIFKTKLWNNVSLSSFHDFSITFEFYFYLDGRRMVLHHEKRWHYKGLQKRKRMLSLCWKMCRCLLPLSISVWASRNWSIETEPNWTTNFIDIDLLGVRNWLDFCKHLINKRTTLNY